MQGASCFTVLAVSCLAAHLAAEASCTHRYHCALQYLLTAQLASVPTPVIDAQMFLTQSTAVMTMMPNVRLSFPRGRGPNLGAVDPPYGIYFAASFSR